MDNEQEEKTLFQTVKEMGLDWDSHETDLYIKCTPEANELIKNYRFKGNVTRFISKVGDRVPWFDVPFAYDPAWEKKLKK